MRKIVLLIVCSVSLLLADASETYMGYKVMKMPFKISGNQYVELKLTEAGPIPVENEDYKITNAGLFVAPSSENKTIPNLFFGFGLTKKSDANVSEIIIEEVFPSEKAMTIYEEKDPQFSDKSWFSKRAHCVVPNEQNTPWLYNAKGSIFVYKFTIKKYDGSFSTLLQLVWFSRELKSSLLQSIAKYKDI